MMRKEYIMASGLVALAVVSRIIAAETAAYNFAPVVAIGLVSGMLVKDTRYALLIALLGQFIADVYFQIFPTPSNYGFYGWSQLFVYGGLVAAALIGTAMRSINVRTIIGGTLAASVSFFILSNLGYFLQGYNGYSVQGFIKTFVDALPFFRNSLQADLIGSAVLFTAYFAGKATFAKQLKSA